MALLKKQEVSPPAVPREEVEVPELNGSVMVRAMFLDERFAWSEGDGDTTNRILAILSTCVRDADDEPLFDREAWRLFCAAHYDAATNLCLVAQRLSGMKSGDEKNSQAPS